MIDDDRIEQLLSEVKAHRMLRHVLATATNVVLALIGSRCELKQVVVTAQAAQVIVRQVMHHAHAPESPAEWIERIDAALATLPPGMVCPHCNLVSYHPEDVANGYCANCHVFHDAASP